MLLARYQILIKVSDSFDEDDLNKLSDKLDGFEPTIEALLIDELLNVNFTNFKIEVIED